MRSMVINTVQKVIKIGDSLGVTLPAKELKRAEIKLGDEVEVIISKVADPNTEEIKKLTEKYENFKKEYEVTIKKLSNGKN